MKRWERPRRGDLVDLAGYAFVIASAGIVIGALYYAANGNGDALVIVESFIINLLGLLAAISIAYLIGIRILQPGRKINDIILLMSSVALIILCQNSLIKIPAEITADISKLVLLENSYLVFGSAFVCVVVVVAIGQFFYHRMPEQIRT